MRCRGALIAVLGLCGSLVPAAGARAATTVPFASHGGRIPWSVNLVARPVGAERLPGLCVNFLWSATPGRTPDTGFPTCVAPAQGRYVGHPRHVRWRFTTNSGRYHGVVPVSGGGAPGILGVFAVVDPRARRVVVRLTDGRVLHLRARPLPARLHRSARLAWAVLVGHAFAGTPPHCRTVRAYDGHGRLVGHWH